MNPFQGLKHTILVLSAPRLRHKRHESLSGIETCQWGRQTVDTNRHKRHESLSGIETNYSTGHSRSKTRHKRHESLSGIETKLNSGGLRCDRVTNDMNPFQGLKREFC